MPPNLAVQMASTARRWHSFGAFHLPPKFGSPMFSFSGDPTEKMTPLSACLPLCLLLLQFTGMRNAEGCPHAAVRRGQTHVPTRANTLSKKIAQRFLICTCCTCVNACATCNFLSDSSPLVFPACVFGSMGGGLSGFPRLCLMLHTS